MLQQPNGTPLVAPKPIITITLEPTPDGSGYQPHLEMTHMPGGWKTCHEALCIAVNLVAHEWVKQVAESGQQRIQLVHALPQERL